MPTPIPPPDSHYISLTQFLAMKKEYAGHSQTILAPPYHGKNILVTSELFNVISISALVAVPGCAAIKIYYGMDNDLAVHAMLVAVDANGNDLLPDEGSAIFARNEGSKPIVEEGQRCPPSC